MVSLSIRLFLAAVAVLTGVAMPAAAAPTAQISPLTIDPTSGPPGTVVQYTGSGFTPGGRVSVLLIEGLGLIVGEPTAASDGTIGGSFTMPDPPGVAELTFGPVALFAIDEATGQETPRATFLLTERAEGETVTVQIQPVGGSGVSGSATLAALNGATRFRISVAGLAPDAAHAVHLMAGDCPTGELQIPLAELRADATGAATATVTVNGNLAAFADGGHSVAVFSEPIPGGRPQTGSVIACGAIPSMAEPLEPVATWYFAEGSSQAPFDTWFLVQNPTNQSARVRFTFQLQPDGGGPQTITRDFTVGATSRLSVFANEVVPDMAFSTRIDSDRAIFAERSMFVGFEGHVVAGIAFPSTHWLFAEGSSQSPFHTWLLLQNPNAEAALATVTYLLQDGASRTQTVSLPGSSRASVFTNEVVPHAAFSMEVDASIPIIAERAMYRFPGNAATGVAGVTAASRSWFFAEGGESSQGLPADSWLLLQNPHPTPVLVTVTVIQEAGAPIDLAYQLAPSSRQSILLNELGDFGSFGIRVEAGAGIVAERSMFIGDEPRGAHATAGSPVLATTWYLAEGSTAPPFDEVIAIMNPSGENALATVEFQLSGGQRVTANFDVPSERKRSIAVDDIIPNAAVSARVTTSVPTVVERTMFFEKPGGTGVHNTIGIR